MNAARRHELLGSETKGLVFPDSKWHELRVCLGSPSLQSQGGATERPSRCCACRGFTSVLKNLELRALELLMMGSKQSHLLNGTVKKPVPSHWKILPVFPKALCCATSLKGWSGIKIVRASVGRMRTNTKDL